MPLWIIYHPPGTFADDEARGALATDITALYTAIGLPRFYVVVEFVQLHYGDTWVGAEKRDGRQRPHIRLVIDHIAVQAPAADDDESRRESAARIERVLEPHVARRGYDWEFHVNEADRRLWRINGFVPPEHPSEVEDLWARENRPVPY
ncbi:hypothetical protein CDD83_120 [Cordyceps sp. RAO-2017]|nr:hypothetical protein CDD83_120 [Cordyceps sp. RAO-2017]